MRRLPTTKFFLPEPALRRRLQATVDQAVDETQDVLVVSHRNCPDGVGSYLIHALVQQNPPPVVWAYPGEVHQVVSDVARHQGEGRTLSINDLSFDRDAVDALQRALKEAKGRGWRIVWRDHHHKQWDGVDTDRLTQHMEKFQLDRDAEECGASLAQKDLAPEDDLMRELASIVRDRDLWINKDPRSETYEMAVEALGADAFVERFLATRDVDAPWIEAAAEEAMRERNEKVEEAVLSASLFGEGGEVGVVYGGEVPTNAVLHTLRSRRGTRLEIAMKPEGRFSVRSAPGTDVAHLLGQAYSGGGHPNAAGGTVPVKPWEWPAYWLRGGDSPAGRSVVKTALRLIEQEDEVQLQQSAGRTAARDRSGSQEGQAAEVDRDEQVPSAKPTATAARSSPNGAQDGSRGEKTQTPQTEPEPVPRHAAGARAAED